MSTIRRHSNPSNPQASPSRVTRADRLREATTHYPDRIKGIRRWVAYLGADPTVLPESDMALAAGASLADPSTWTDLPGAIEIANQHRSVRGVAFVVGNGWTQVRYTNPTKADIDLGVVCEPCADGTNDLRVLLENTWETTFDDEVNPRWPNESRQTEIRHRLWAVPVPLQLVGQVEPVTAAELLDQVAQDEAWADIVSRNDHTAAARVMFTTALVESDGSKADRAYFVDTVQSALTSAGIDPPTKRDLDTAYTAAKASLPPRSKQVSKAQKHAERAERQDGFVDDIDHAAALLREVESAGHLYLATERVWLLRDSRTGLLRRASAPDAAGLYDFATEWTKVHTELLDLGNRSALTHAQRLAHAVTNRQSIHATIDQLDRHGDLVGTPDGVLDLRTGLVRRATNDERVTMSLSCSPAATYEGSVWIEWLQRVVPDATERTLLQNLMGYTLCGKRDGKLFVVLYGTSGAGKSAFLETMNRVFGDYMATAPQRQLYDSDNESSCDYAFAALHGKRLALADELKSHRTLAEDFIKALSTGATVTARKRFGHEQDVVATACLWISTNDLPRIRNGGDALVVRARVFAWHQVLNQHDIRDRLYADLPAALAWAVEGAQRYLANGPACLAATDDMADAAQEWLSEDAYNPMRRFVRDCVRHQPGAVSWVSTDFKDAYEAWARSQDRVDAKFSAKELRNALVGAGLLRSGPDVPHPAYHSKRFDPQVAAQGSCYVNLAVGYAPKVRPITPLEADMTADGLPV